MLAEDLSAFIERHSLVIEVLGFTGAILAIAANAMKTMIPLRIANLVASVLFVIYGAVLPSYPQVLVHGVLVPVHAVRLRQMMRLIADVKKSARGDLALDALMPYSETRSYNAGETVFRKGDAADTLYVTRAGRFELVELGRELGTNEVVGEIGLVEPDNRRTATFTCLADGQLLAINYDRVKELYFQNPEFGFYFLNLISKRLLAENAGLVEEVKRMRGV